jgi:hypothetical protein
MSRENPKEKYVALVGKGTNYQILKEDAGKHFYATASRITITLPDSNVVAVDGFSVFVGGFSDESCTVECDEAEEIYYLDEAATSVTVPGGNADVEFCCIEAGLWIALARPPMAHSASHGSAGSDPVTPAAIGAQEASDNVKFTAEGGLAILLVNKTGAASVKGSVLEPYSATAVDNAVKLAAAGGNHPVGVMYDDGVADGDAVWVVVSGRAQVLLENSVAGVRDYWLGTSNSTAGRAQCTTNPTSQTEHMQELGHCIEAKTAGTDVLAYAILHFN